MRRTARKTPADPTEQDLEALHAAFVAPPADLDEDDRPATLAGLARKLGVPLGTATQWALGEYWREERAAAYARAWAAKFYPGVPLDLEGFAATYAGSRLDRREALAWGRELWYRTLAPIAHWEELRIILEAQQRIQAERDAEARRAA